MPDYKALYFALFRATAQATAQMVEAQRQAEAMFCEANDASPLLFVQKGHPQQPAQRGEVKGQPVTPKVP